MFLKHNCITTKQPDYIRRIKIEASKCDTIIEPIDFVESYNLLQQNSITQAYWTTLQAATLMINIQVDRDTPHSMAIISDYLEHDVEFVHATQNITVDHAQST